jgi:hypothetical protein
MLPGILPNLRPRCKATRQKQNHYPNRCFHYRHVFILTAIYRLIIGEGPLNPKQD